VRLFESSDRRTLEGTAAAEHYRRQLETVANNATLALFIMDERQYCTYLNPAAERLTGFTLAELQGGPLHDYIHHTRPDGSRYPIEECPLDHAFLLNSCEQGEEVFIHKTGRFYPVAFTASPILNESGVPEGTILEVRGIGDERLAQERERLLRESELERARLAAVFQHAPSFMATLRGPDHIFELVNPTCSQLLGNRELVGHPLREILPELAEQELFLILDRVYRTGEPFIGNEVRLEYRREPDEGPRERFINVVFQPLLDKSGEVSGILAHGVSVTELVEARRRAERQSIELEAYAEDAERARRQAERANLVKSEFLAMMSHELRTPLNAMIGYTDLLLEGIPEPIPDSARRKVERIEASAHHLQEMIEEILSFSRLEAGEARVEIETMAPAILIAEVQALLEPLALARGIRFECQAASGLPPMRSDRGKVRQILINLVGNAIKFTDEGGVRLEVEAKGDEIVFRVIDTGPGIPAEQLPRIFDPFWQAEAGLTRKSSGTGLGLSVAQQLAALLRGRLMVASEVGRGTSFTAWFPVEA
jgi:PAS domain S-box-containing protein